MFWELSLRAQTFKTLITSPYLKTSGSQIDGLFKGRRRLPLIFWLKTLRDSKVRAAKDHGKKFQNRLAASFSVIVHAIESSFGKSE